VKVEAEQDRILAIGGNVSGAVSLKLLPASFEQRDGMFFAHSIGRGGRTVFAHLKLLAPSVEADVLESTPTLRALSEQVDLLATLERRLAGETPPNPGLALETS